MKIRILMPLCIIIFILESTLFTNLRIFSVTFDLALVLLVLLSLLFSEKEGIVVALVCGLLRDVFFTKALGINTLSMLIIVLLISMFSDFIHKENPLNTMVLMVVATGGFNLLYYLFNIVSENQMNFSPFLKIFVIESILNTVICYLLYKFVFSRFLKRQGVM